MCVVGACSPGQIKSYACKSVNSNTAPSSMLEHEGYRKQRTPSQMPRQKIGNIETSDMLSTVPATTPQSTDLGGLTRVLQSNSRSQKLNRYSITNNSSQPKHHYKPRIIKCPFNHLNLSHFNKDPSLPNTILQTRELPPTRDNPKTKFKPV